MEVMEIKDNIEYESANIDEDKEVIVHCTDFFPKDGIILCNYDGNKKGTARLSYEGVIKEVDSLMHRHTTHFARNGVVRSTGDGAGNWEQPKYIIIEPLDPHMDEFVDLSPNDSYTNGSVKLTEKPIMLVRSDCYDEIPEDQYAPFTVMKYTGDYVECVEKAFGILGIRSDIDKIDPNGAGHAHSLEMTKEQLLNYRNLCINYLIDNAWDGKSDIVLTEEQLFYLFDIAKENNYFSVGDIYSINSSNMKDWFMFYMLLTNMGVQKKENGFVFKSESDMLDYFEEIGEMRSLKEEDVVERLTKYYEEGPEKARDLYKNYLLFEKNRLQANKENVDIIDVDKMKVSELYEFEHHQEAKMVADIHKQKGLPAELVITKTGIIIDGIVTESGYNLDYLSSNLDGEFDSSGNFWFTYNIDNDVKDLYEIDDYISGVISYSKIIKDESEQILAEEKDSTSSKTI